MSYIIKKYLHHIWLPSRGINRTNLRTYSKLNCFILDSETVQRWIELFKKDLFWHLTVCKQKLYLYYTKLFYLELFD